MKKLTNLTAIFCSILLLFLAVTGSSILADLDWVSDWTDGGLNSFYYQEDLDRIDAFMNQVDENGITNAEKCNCEETADPVLWGFEYDGENTYDFIELFINYNVWPCYWSGYLDFYGAFDFTGTTIREVYLDTCRINEIILDNCRNLSKLTLKNLSECTRISTVGSTLESGKINVNTCSIKRMDLGVRHFDTAIHALAIGGGKLGAEFFSTDEANVILSSRQLGYENNFIGWFKDGELISDANGIVVHEGGNYIAAFAGDVTNDGCLNVADAVQLMREALGVVETRDVTMSDINYDGSVGINDAVLLLRAVMGI